MDGKLEILFQTTSISGITRAELRCLEIDNLVAYPGLVTDMVLLFQTVNNIGKLFVTTDQGTFIRGRVEIRDKGAYQTIDQLLLAANQIRRASRGIKPVPIDPEIVTESFGPFVTRIFSDQSNSIPLRFVIHDESEAVRRPTEENSDDGMIYVSDLDTHASDEDIVEFDTNAYAEQTIKHPLNTDNTDKASEETELPEGSGMIENFEIIETSFSSRDRTRFISS